MEAPDRRVYSMAAAHRGARQPELSGQRDLVAETGLDRQLAGLDGALELSASW